MDKIENVNLKKQNEIARLESEVKLLLDVVHNNDDLAQLLRHPHINKQDKMRMMDENFSEKIKALQITIITTAVELGSEEKKQIEERLIGITNRKNIEIHFTVNPEIIGGIIIQIGDKIVDNSIQTKLKRISRDLFGIELVS